jgi:hypothetical protein
MEVEFSLLPEDFVAARSYQARRHWKQLFFLHLAFSIILTGVFVCLTVVPAIKQAGLLPGLITVAILFLIHLILYLILYLSRHRIAASQMAKFLRQGKNSKLLEPRKLTISTEGISESSTNYAGITIWTGIEKIGITEHHAFFYVSTQRAIILPRRAFAGRQDFMNFVETAQHYFEVADKEPEAANKELEPA